MAVSDGFRNLYTDTPYHIAGADGASVSRPQHTIARMTRDACCKAACNARQVSMLTGDTLQANFDMLLTSSGHTFIHTGHAVSTNAHIHDQP